MGASNPEEETSLVKLNYGRRSRFHESPILESNASLHAQFSPQKEFVLSAIFFG